MKAFAPSDRHAGDGPVSGRSPDSPSERLSVAPSGVREMSLLGECFHASAYVRPKSPGLVFLGLFFPLIVAIVIVVVVILLLLNHHHSSGNAGSGQSGAVNDFRTFVGPTEGEPPANNPSAGVAWNAGNPVTNDSVATPLLTLINNYRTAKGLTARLA